MKAHHLSCGTMRMPTVPTLVSHVLLLETDAGLVLVDTGFGLEDIAGQARVQRGADPGRGRPDGAGSPRTTAG